MNIFDPDSKFSQIMETIFDYAKLGLLVFVLSIPVVTAGAAATAAMSVGMKIVRGEAPTLWKPFWRSFRENFKQTVPLVFLCVAFFGLLSLDWWYAMKMESTVGIRLLRVGTFIAAVLGAMITLYIFPILARYRLNNRQIIRNAAVYAIINFPKNLLAIVILLIGAVLMDYAVALLPVIVLAIPSVMIRYMSVVCVSSFRKSEERQKGEDKSE